MRMKAKKNKDLENELISDLLADDKTLPLVSHLEKSAQQNEYEKSNVTDLKERSRASTKSSAGSLPEETLRLNESQVVSSQPHEPSQSNRSAMTFDQSVRTTVGGRFAIRPNATAAVMGSEAALVQSENLKVAQQRIFDLEEEIQRLRTESEELAAAGETLSRRVDELIAENEMKTKKLDDIKERYDSEKEILEESLKAKDREVKGLRMKVSEFEVRLSTNLQKIRVRERELENRLELFKMESSAVVRSKDETMLELKRQIDQLSVELNNHRAKGQELNKQLAENQETARRTVKALRLALGLLEGGVEDSEPIKKAK
jgi:hypothetical protein